MNNSASVHLDRKVNDLSLHDPGKDLLLDLVAVLEELLDDIVAEDILHQLDGIRLDLSENLILLVAVRSLQLLLDESRTMLITTKFDDVVVDILAQS